MLRIDNHEWFILCGAAALGTTRAFTQPGSQGPLLPVGRLGEESGNDVDIHSPRRILQFAV